MTTQPSDPNQDPQQPVPDPAQEPPTKQAPPRR